MYGYIASSVAGMGVVSAIFVAIYVGALGIAFIDGAYKYTNHEAVGAARRLKIVGDESRELRESADLIEQPLAEHMLAALEENRDAFSGPGIAIAYKQTAEDLRDRLRAIETNDRLAARVAASLTGVQ